MKPLKQRRLLDYFPPDGAEKHRVRFDNNLGVNHNGRKDVPAATAELIPTRWRTIISLEMQGHSKTDIAKLVGMSLGGVSNITNDDRYIGYRETLLGELDREFFAMKPLAFKALRDGFSNPDANVALRAAETWFRGASFGGYAKDPVKPTNVSAEDVAKQLLQVHAENVQININSDD